MNFSTKMIHILKFEKKLAKTIAEDAKQMSRRVKGSLDTDGSLEIDYLNT